MQEGQKSLVGRFAGAETTEEVALQEISLARLARLVGCRRAPGGPLVLQEPFQHIDGAGE
jgi:hypothetical protein